MTEIGRVETTPNLPHAAVVQFGTVNGCHDGHDRAGGQQSECLAGADRSTTDDEDRDVGEVQKHRKVEGHRVTVLCVGQTRSMVWLVGAGPGDPDLLTLAAARVLQAADVVVHDALVGDGVLAMIPASAETIDVGKRPGAPVDQAAINALLVEHGSAGRSVVRLKGGDPYVFGRGGEEAQALSAAGVSWRVVPGVSAAFAAPALAGVPVTHRGISGAVTVLTGHRQPDGSAVNWNALAQVGGTLVILMGVAHRGEIAGALMAGGLVAETPVCIIEQASTPEERVRRCALAELGDTAVAAPATLVIGPVAGLDLGYGGS